MIPVYDIGDILIVKDINLRLADREISIEITPKAEKYIVEEGYDPVYGARPLKRYLQSKVETLIARRIIAADVKPGDVLTVDVNEDGKLFVK